MAVFSVHQPVQLARQSIGRTIALQQSPARLTAHDQVPAIATCDTSIIRRQRIRSAARRDSNDHRHAGDRPTAIVAVPITVNAAVAAAKASRSRPRLRPALRHRPGRRRGADEAQSRPVGRTTCKLGRRHRQPFDGRGKVGNIRRTRPIRLPGHDSTTGASTQFVAPAGRAGPTPALTHLQARMTDIGAGNAELAEDSGSNGSNARRESPPPQLAVHGRGARPRAAAPRSGRAGYESPAPDRPHASRSWARSMLTPPR